MYILNLCICLKYLSFKLKFTYHNYETRRIPKYTKKHSHPNKARYEQQFKSTLSLSEPFRRRKIFLDTFLMRCRIRNQFSDYSPLIVRSFATKARNGERFEDGAFPRNEIEAFRRQNETALNGILRQAVMGASSRSPAQISNPLAALVKKGFTPKEKRASKASSFHLPNWLVGLSVGRASRPIFLAKLGFDALAFYGRMNNAIKIERKF